MLLITWKEWSGKTMIATILWSFYSNIVSNYDIFQNEKKINKTFENVTDLIDLPFSKKKGVIIFDEMWVNANARESMWSANILLSKFIVVSRKTNMDIIFIGQRDWMIDKNVRQAAHWKIEMYSYFLRPDYLMFKWRVKKLDNQWNEYLCKIFSFDGIKWLKLLNLKYNSLEKSVLSNSMKYQKLKKSIDIEF